MRYWNEKKYNSHVGVALRYERGVLKTTWAAFWDVLIGVGNWMM